jgi:hypothetical protein
MSYHFYVGRLPTLFWALMIGLAIVALLLLFI